MRTLLRDASSFLVDLLLPPRASERVVRETGLAALQALADESDEPGTLPYHDPRVTALVWEVKYHRNRRALLLAGALLADALIDLAQDGIGRPLLIPVPMHPARRRERGHNHAELLCDAVLERLRRAGQGEFAEYAPRALRRERHTPPQQGLPKSARLHNIEGSMRAAEPARIRGRRCIVLDDVTTTGATFTEAARALAEAGASSIGRLALAHS